MKLKHDVFRVYTRRTEISNFTFLCLVLIFGFWLIGRDFRENYIIQPSLLAEGVETTGTYIDRERRDTGSRGSTSYTYFLTYNYTVDGRIYSRQYSTSRATYSRTDIGATTQIRYLPDAPHISRTVDIISQPTTDDHGYLTTWIILYLIPLLFFLRQIAFRLFGRPLDGEITHISGTWEERSGWGRKQQDVITVRYQFVEPKTGKSISREAKSTRNDLKEKPLPAVGTRLVVLYLNKYFYRVL